MAVVLRRNPTPRRQRVQAILMAQEARQGETIAGRVRVNPKAKGGRKNPKRGSKPMARRSAAQKAATRRMIAANRRGRTNPRRKKRRNPARKNPARKRRRNPGTALARRNGATTMARTNGRKRRRRNGARIVRRRRRNPGGIARLNPMRPGPLLKTAIGAAIPAIGAGAASAFLDTKIRTMTGSGPDSFVVKNNNLVRIAVKLGSAALAAGLLRRRPNVAYATMGAILGSIGAEIGVRAANGVVAVPGAAGMKEIANMAAGDPEMLSALYDEMSGMGLIDNGSIPVELGGDMGDDIGAEYEPDLGDSDDDDIITGFDGEDDEYSIAS